MAHTPEYRRNWYAKNREHCRAYRKRWKRLNPEKMRAYRLKNPRSCLERRREFKAVIDLIKASPCQDCGNRYPSRVMEFDHRNPAEKTLNISRLVGKLVTRANRVRIIKEIEKCDLVCANCHRIREIGRQAGLTTPKPVKDYSI